MGLRAELVVRTVQYLMGPQNGWNEVLPSDRDPRDEYITGVLAPRPDPASPPVGAVLDIDADVDLLEGDVDAEDDEDDPGVIPSSGVFSPALDPRAQPRSIGLTFVVEADGEPELSLCATYARYFKLDDGCWARQAYCMVANQVVAIDGLRETGPANAEVRIRLTPVATNPAARRISVFLVNVAEAPRPDEPVPTSSLIFQPQIRIRLGTNCRIISLPRNAILSSPGSVNDPVDEEEMSLELLYHEEPILARGHMCSAVWADIDPERDTPSGEANPFTWVDEPAVPVEDRATFRCPDVRTEIIPLFPVCAPSTEWDVKYGPEPERDPLKLAQLWEPAAMRAALQPLPDGYARWIAEQKKLVDRLPARLQATAHRHIALCERTHNRLQEAVELLCNNASSEVRLAFCFANQAIALQASWKHRRTSAAKVGENAAIRWYPFQLAFILLNLPSIADRSHPDRDVCDLLWFATGGGKTEAYLGLAAFTLSLRRLRAARDYQQHRIDTGTGMISRYTLRLLTIQQFRRALGVIIACEILRVQPHTGGAIGWRPGDCPISDDYLWGTARFSIGLWVGGGVTPNRLESTGWPERPGALTLLRQSIVGHGEPAQVLQCPCCGAHLAIAQPRHDRQERPAFPPGHGGTLHYVIYSDQPVSLPPPGALTNSYLEVTDPPIITPLPAPNFYTLTVKFTATGEGVSASDIDRWWEERVRPVLPRWASLECARASRPGYFIRSYRTRQGYDRDYDFEIYCPAPDCPLAAGVWREKVPVAVSANSASGSDCEWQEVIAPFQRPTDPHAGTRIPIPAVTVDDQIYARPPSLLIATVDKFARLAFEPRAASIFGFVTHYHARHGYYREGCPGGASKTGTDHPSLPALRRAVTRFAPPDLILQDELHLIDGPLGSMVGMYEAAIDALAEVRSDGRVMRPKYIASTATVRQAGEQVEALFCRQLAQFPPPALSAKENFFSRTGESHPVEDQRAGRLYLGICAPGKGAQTPIVRIWSVLLQLAFEARQRVPSSEVDGFWTLVGYFNAIRELAGALGLYRQDIPPRISYLAGSGPHRELREAIELSSRADTLQLPALLSRLEVELPGEAEDTVLATSMFGTGVDVARLGLMFVHGQPKTSSAYIQATGRVGRRRGGLVVSFFRASRPRDLDHYEFFTGYHRQLYRAVEPVTVAPFSPRARDRALGPLCVLLLRQAEEILGYRVDAAWRREQGPVGPQRMAIARTHPEVEALKDLLEVRAQRQPVGRRPDPGRIAQEVASELDRWKSLASKHPGNSGLVYHEYGLSQNPVHPVVLGDAQHEHRDLEVAFEDTPQSLRDVEPTTGFKI